MSHHVTSHHINNAGRVCDLGTDCDDCRDAGAENGVRMFCFDCPEECRERNRNIPPEKLVELACFQFQFKDGTCDTSCNNRECVHDSSDTAPMQHAPPHLHAFSALQ